MPIEKLRPSFTFTEDRLKELEQVVPEAFADGKINWNILKEALGEYLEDEENGIEYFGLNWPGKRQARMLASKPSKGTLVPCPGEGINEDETENIFIEGDNLEVLKLLQKSYAGKIKMIYIDPPYNTGNDLIYNDKFTEPLNAYLEYTGTLGNNSELLTSNTYSDGRFHTKWLNLMYPRLLLARNLLQDDGLIFISIDDNEVFNLRYLMNEIFGEENFIGLISIMCNPKGRSHDKYLATCHEYNMIFSKTSLPTGVLSVKKTDQEIINDYPKSDELGPYRELELRNTHREFGKHNRPNLFYSFFIDENGSVFLDWKENRIEVKPIWNDGYEGCWSWGVKKSTDNLDLLIAKNIDENWKIYRKAYAYENGSRASKKMKSLWLDKKYHTEKGQAVFNSLFNSKEKIFQSPKSIDLIKDMIRMCNEKNCVILDFFAGSSTTAHAVMDLNREDGGSRKYIMVQMTEKINNSKYSTIADISKERIRKAIKKYEEENVLNRFLEKTENQTDQSNHHGFKVFKLTSSSFKIWQISKELHLDNMNTIFDYYSDPLIKNWEKANLLYEIILQEGFPLSSEIEIQDFIELNEVYKISAINYCDHKLYICLDNLIKNNTVQLLKLNTKDIFICLDNAINDELKAQIDDKYNVHVV